MRVLPKPLFCQPALLFISRWPSSEALPSEADNGHDQEQGTSGVEAGSGRQAGHRECSGVQGISAFHSGTGSWYHASVWFDWLRLYSRYHRDIEKAIDDHMVLVAIKVRAYRNRAVKDKGCLFTRTIVPCSFLGRTFIAYAAAVPFLHCTVWGRGYLWCILRVETPPGRVWSGARATNHPHEWPPMCRHTLRVQLLERSARNMQAPSKSKSVTTCAHESSMP